MDVIQTNYFGCLLIIEIWILSTTKIILVV